MAGLKMWPRRFWKRYSPIVTLIEMLIGKGCQIVIHDDHVSRTNIIGANREYVERKIHHLWSLMEGTTQEIIDGCNTIIISNGLKEYRNLDDTLNGRMIVYLTRALAGCQSGERYQGMCW